MKHTLKLSRPLNAPIVTLSTSAGERHFLIDSGFHGLGWSREGVTILAGDQGWHPTQALSLPQMNIDLSYFERLIGLAVEGFIGPQALRMFDQVTLDFDQGTLELERGEAIQQGRSATEVTLQMRTPFSIEASFGDGPAQGVFIDTGSRYCINRRSTGDKRYQMQLPSAFGLISASVTEHSVSVRDVEDKTHTQRSCEVARFEGPVPSPPFNMLGIGWLSQFGRCCFDFVHQQLHLSARTHERKVWEGITAEHKGLPVNPLLNPKELKDTARRFQLAPTHPSQPLPPQLSPEAWYTLEGLDVPPGIEGVNVLYERLISREGGALCFQSDEGVTSLPRAPIYS